MSSTPHKPGKRSRQSSHSLERVGSALTTPQRSPALQPSAAAALPPPQQQQQRPSLSSSLPRSSSPSAPRDVPHTHKQKKNKKAKAEAAAAAAKAKAAHTGNGKGGDKINSAAAAAAQSRRLLRCLSEVELQFQLEQDRTQRTTLAPRDLANLILWSVPAPVPLIESPRIFFVKNKSRVRNVTVIYVNGWSYDELLCTGVGLPRQPATSTPSTLATTTNTQNAAPADRCEEWDKALCSAMLSPVREARCWARPGRGSGCAGGVQYAPLTIPSTRNELEKDLWWRNDAPRRPRDGSSSSSGGGGIRGVSGNPATTSVDAQGSGAEAFDRTAASSLFRLAMQSHTAAAAAAAEGTGTTENASGNGETPASDKATSPFHAHQDLWRDRALLTTYALRLPTHAAELTELGFTLTAPPTPPALSASGLDRIDEESGEKEAPSAADGVEEQQWACFDAPVSTASSSSSTAGSADDGADTPQLRVVALDCEMVLVESGESALARATLVDVLTGDVVMDILVKPQQRVTDYLTRFSGIDKDMLDPVSATLADCQAQMKRFIDTATFVIGHSLENDFKACRFIPNCEVLDTAWLFPHPAGLPYKNALRFLAQRYLNRRIQQGAHDSAVDALVSAELVQLKLLHGPTFGIRPRVSVLSLITAAAAAAGEDTAAAAAAPQSNASSIAASTAVENATTAAAKPPPPMRASRPAPALDVHVHLFDDPVTLTAILPAGDAGGRIDAVPVRHDEDATRKIVRALQRRSAELRAADAREEKAQLHDGVQMTSSTERGEEDEAAMAPPSFGLYWVQLTQTKVDVVLPKPSNNGDDGAAEDVTSSAATTASKEHTAAQFQTVHDTNRRILRVIEACPEETVVVVLAGRCNGEAGGNHFSRAQGTCFAFVKDSTAPGPREDEMVRRTAEDEAADKEQHQHQQGDHNVANGASSGVKAAAVLEATPPACQQQ